MSHLEHAPIESNVFKARLFWLGHRPGHRRQELHAQARHARGPGHGRGDRAGDRHLGPVDASRPSGSSATVPARSCCAPSACWRSTSTWPEPDHRPLRPGRGLPAGRRRHHLDGGLSRPAQPRSRSARPTSPRSATPSPARRAAARNGHKGGVLWFTGLSGAGKSTLALALERELFAKGYVSLRPGRRQYPRRAQRQSGLLARRTGPRTSAASARWRRCSPMPASSSSRSFISPYRADRERARAAAKDAFPRDLRQGLARGLRDPRPQGALPARPQGRDPGLHRHQQPLRAARAAGSRGADRRAGRRGVPGAADSLRRRALSGSEQPVAARADRQGSAGDPAPGEAAGPGRLIGVPARTGPRACARLRSGAHLVQRGAERLAQPAPPLGGDGQGTRAFHPA